MWCRGAKEDKLPSISDKTHLKAMQDTTLELLVGEPTWENSEPYKSGGPHIT